jgi:predicted short-subunit dehydrogenase-like oxidoreductase (DUF2520 family)
LELSYTCWHRKQSIAQLKQELQHASHVLILISDQAIETFAASYLKNTQALLIHFSGSLVTAHAYGAHPLSSFNHDLWDLEQYQSIPFILDEDAPALATLLPGLPNQHVRLSKTLKPKYHALCVLSGNFSCMLWQKFFSTLEQEFHLPRTIAFPYVTQIMQNLLSHSPGALTGPLVRGDKETIEKNVMALQSDPFQDVYQSFVNCYQQMKKEHV